MPNVQVLRTCARARPLAEQRVWCKVVRVDHINPHAVRTQVCTIYTYTDIRVLRMNGPQTRTRTYAVDRLRTPSREADRGKERGRTPFSVGVRTAGDGSYHAVVFVSLRLAAGRPAYGRQPPQLHAHVRGAQRGGAGRAHCRSTEHGARTTRDGPHVRRVGRPAGVAAGAWDKLVQPLLLPVCPYI